MQRETIVKEIEFDILWDLRPGIGTRMKNKINFEHNDREPVIESICERIDCCKYQDTLFEICIFGTLPYWLISDITWALCARGDVRHIHFCHPNGSCYTVPVDEKGE